MIKPVPFKMSVWGLLHQAFSQTQLTDSTTDSNHTNLAGFETTVQTLIFPVGICVELGIVGVDRAVLLEAIFDLAVVRGRAVTADVVVAASRVGHGWCGDASPRLRL